MPEKCPAYPQESRLIHILILIICSGIIVGAIILSPPESESSLVKLGKVPLPSICTFRNITGKPCPGCGLVRSLVAAVRGDFRTSLAFHRLGLVTLFYILLQFFYRLGWILIPVLWARIFPSGKWLNLGFIVLGIFFGLNWIFTLLF